MWVDSFSYRYWDRISRALRWALITLIATMLFAAGGHTEPANEADAVPVLTLNETTNDISLEPYLVYKKDLAGNLTPAQAASVKYGKISDGLVYSRGIHWFKFSIKNPFDEPMALLFDTKNELASKIALYSLPLRSSAQSLEEPTLLYSISTREPLSERPFYHHRIILPVNIPRNSQLTFLYRSDHHEPWPPRITNVNHFIGANHHAKVFMFFYGFSVGLLIYNIFLWVSTKETAFLFYSLFVISFLIYTGIHNGTLLYFLPAQWLGQNTQSLNNLVSYLVVIAFCQFTRLYLDLQKLNKTMDRLQVLFIGCFSVAFCLGLFQFQLQDNIISLTEAVFYCTEFSIGLILFLRKHTAAKYYLIAFSFYILSTILVISTLVVDIPAENLIIDYGMEGGFLAQIVLLSIGLGDRMNRLKMEGFRQRELILSANAQSQARTHAILCQHEP